MADTNRLSSAIAALSRIKFRKSEEELGASTKNINRFLSQKFRFYTFICIALLLFVHGYNLNETYLTPFSHVSEKLTLTSFIEYLFANGILRFRIPLLFIISGYIYALQDQKPYGERIRKRFKTLIIPFLIWSAVGLAITFLWQQFPLTAQAVRESRMDQMGDNRPYSEIGWSGIIQRWLMRPVSFQLWFIRSLFVYNMLYPVFKWAILRYPRLWFSLLFFLWVTMFNIFLFEGQGLFFFSLGIWLNKRNIPVHRKPKWFSHFLSWLFFIGTSVIKTFMAFELEPGTTAAFWTLSILHIISVSAGIIAIWFGADAIVKWFMNQRWFVRATSLAFILYALHVPLIHYFTRLAFIFWHNIPNYRLITYIIVPVFVFTLCMLIGMAFRSIAPRLYRITTGGRGF
jgi:fucose 4-O-acetylase-like acetyltransferase